MKAPTSLLNRPGRAAAVVGVVVAVSATAAMALVAGTAAADEPGRCTENVNVRAEPDATSRIVALCEAGTQVQVGETRDGFVQLTDLGGWSAQEYISVDGAAPAAPAPAASDPEAPAASGDDSGDAAAPGTEPGSGEDGSGDPAPEEEPEGSSTGGLLG
jgi:hypothetical protein